MKIPKKGNADFLPPGTTKNIPDEPATLDLENVSLSYNGLAVLQELTFQVAHGASLAVVGPNGAGKSTLFKALVGLLPIQRGNIHIHGRPLGHHQDCVAYLPQREDVDWRFPVTVMDVVMMGRFGQQGWLRRPTKADRAIVAQTLEEMGISDLADRSIGDLSGGQQQRAFLARALAQKPHILLMDEPFTGVDFTTQEITLSLLDHLQAQQVTVMVATHDLNLAAERFRRVLLLNRRVIAYGPPDEVFTPRYLSQAFGEKLLILDGAIVVDECCPPEEEPEGWSKS
jgi:manganese/iron transport system ATP-binding protein